MYSRGVTETPLCILATRTHTHFCTTIGLDFDFMLGVGQTTTLDEKPKQTTTTLLPPLVRNGSYPCVYNRQTALFSLWLLTVRPLQLVTASTLPRHLPIQLTVDSSRFRIVSLSSRDQLRPLPPRQCVCLIVSPQHWRGRGLLRVSRTRKWERLLR
jgi:hypothetical protein